MASPSYRIAFRDWFGLWRSTADLLAALYEAQGQARPAVELAREAHIAEGAVCFHIHKLRAVLEADGIHTVDGPGYRLTEAALAECRSVLHALGQELSRAP